MCTNMTYYIDYDELDESHTLSEKYSSTATIKELQANSWEEAMQLYYDYLNYGTYVPMKD